MIIVDYIDMRTLSEEPHAGRVLGWVMAANDLAFTLYMQDHLKSLGGNNGDLGRLFVKASLLFVQRCMFSLAAEAVEMAALCKDSQFFKDLICTHDEAEKAFARICRLTDKPVPQDMEELAALLSRIRNKGTFHYYCKRDQNLSSWFQEAIETRARESSQPAAALIGEANALTRFTFADDVFDSVFIRHILQADTSDWEKENRRLVSMLIDPCSDVRVIGDTIGKELLRRFPHTVHRDSSNTGL